MVIFQQLKPLKSPTLPALPQAENEIIKILKKTLGSSFMDLCAAVQFFNCGSTYP
jgi:hypothetical protein